MDLKKMIGARIGEIRKQKRMTQEELSGKMGVSPKYLSSIERGRENPTLNTLISLTESLNINMSELFDIIEVEDPSRRKNILTALLKEADEGQVKLALKILSTIIKVK